MSQETEKNYDEALLRFLFNLILDNDQRRILTLILENYDEVRITEELIKYIPVTQSNAEI